MGTLEKKVAEKAMEERFVWLKMVVEEGKRREMMETERQKDEMEVEIAEVEGKIREKEEELERLVSKVEVLRMRFWRVWC